MTQKLFFEKMHGAGNDFVLIDNRTQNFTPDKHLVKFLADRHLGIGFDQLLLIDDANEPNCDVAYRFFNPDGSQAEQCGNGQRCITRYLHNQNQNQSQFCISGSAGLISSVVNKDNTITVNMGKVSSIKSIIIEDIVCFQIGFGNPHLVCELPNIMNTNLFDLNQKFTQDYRDGINFEIAQIIDKTSIKLRVYERGTGETLACGSGACASVAALQFAKKLNNRAKVFLPGGNLMVEYNHNNNNYYLTGPATHVFSGEISI